MKIRPLKGPKGLQALSANCKLLLGVMQTPAFAGVSYEDFFASFQEMTETEKERVIRLAVGLVDLYSEEVHAIVSFAEDSNGVPYTKENIDNLGVKELFEAVVAVCMEVSRIDISLVTPKEKKSSPPSP